jgi:hypothetical protein
MASSVSAGVGCPLPRIHDVVYPRSGRTALDVGYETADFSGEFFQWEETTDIHDYHEKAIVIEGDLGP